MIPSAYFFRKYWDRYHQRLPVQFGGMSQTEISPTSLWRQHFFGELLEKAWSVLMRDIMPADTWIELEAFTRYWQRRRHAYMLPGGFLVTTSGKPREIFTPTGKPRKLGERPNTTQYDDCIDVTYAKYVRMVNSHKKPSRAATFLGRLLEKAGVLTARCIEQQKLTSEQVIAMALSGAITGQIGGRSEIRYRRSRAYSKGQENRRLQERKPVVKSATSEYVPSAVLRHVLHYFSGGRVFLWISKLVYG